MFGTLGTGVFVGPNTINFNTVFDNFAEKLAENAAVVGTVIGIVVLYLLMIPLLRRFDIKDKLAVRFAYISFWYGIAYFPD